MKLLELLLTENVDNLGIVGDVVKVRPGYARNFLLPRSLATKPTEGNIKRLAERRKKVEEEMRLRRAQMESLIEKLKGFELTLQRSANEQGILFGGVSQHDITEAMRAEGFPVEDRMVRIGQQIKRLDSYQIPIVLAADLKTEIKLWVVSDRPMEQEEAQERSEDQPAQEQAEAPTEKPAEEAPKKKSRKKKDQPEQPQA